jgi:hypothetical protein
MFRFVKRWFDERRRAEAAAERMIAQHGREARAIVNRICRDQSRDPAYRRFHCLVRRRIEKKLGIPPRVDTATRYLVSN